MILPAQPIQRAASIRSLDAAWTQFADKNLTAPIQDLADTFNELKSDDVERYFETAKRGVLLLGGAIVASKIIGGIASISRFRNKKSHGANSANPLGAAAGAPIPVYVVNFGAGGDFGGSAEKGDKKTTRKGSKKTTHASNLAKRTLPGIGAVTAVGATVSQSAKGITQRGARLASRTKGASRAIPLAAVAGGAYQAYDIATSQKPMLDKVDDSLALAGGVGGGLAGAKLGAVIGTDILPGIGTAIGGALGGLGGYLAGEYGGDKFGDWITAKDTVNQKNTDAMPTAEAIGQEVAKAMT